MDLSLHIGMNAWLVSLLANALRIFRSNDIEQQQLRLAKRELIGAKEDLERKTEELALAKERYVLAAEATNEGLWDWNPLTKEQYLSARWKALLGFVEDDLSNTEESFFSRIHPDDESQVREALRLHFEERQPYNVELRLRCKDGSYRWFRTRGKDIRDDKGRVTRMVGSIFDITERKQAAEHLDFLMQELSHRSKNLLAVIEAMANLSAKASTSMEEFRRRFSQRLQGLAVSHDLLVQQNLQGGDLAELVDRQLAPFADVGDGRLDAGGPSVSLDGRSVQNVGLLFHELATNASKYGALSMPEGKIVIRWTLDPVETSSRCLRISWRERGGPPVKTPEHKGFGLMVIERIVAKVLNGSVSVDFSLEGLACTLDIPTAHVIKPV